MALGGGAGAAPLPRSAAEQPACGPGGGPLEAAVALLSAGRVEAARDALLEAGEGDLAVIAALSGELGARSGRDDPLKPPAEPRHRRPAGDRAAWVEAALAAAARAAASGDAHRAAALQLAAGAPGGAACAYRAAGLWREALAALCAAAHPRAAAGLRRDYAAAASAAGLQEVAAANWLAAGAPAAAAAALAARAEGGGGGAAAALGGAEVALRAVRPAGGGHVLGMGCGSLV
jgi:hypothetical protein